MNSIIERKGFTFIELMIVVAIIAALAAVVIPAFQSHFTRDRINKVIKDIQILEQDILTYEALNDVFPDDLSQIKTDIILTDPWGNPYEYLKVEGASIGKLRKDHNLVPVNTDYDLYSMGKDGKSASPFTAKISQDDIVRANDGQFIGLVADY